MSIKNVKTIVGTTLAGVLVVIYIYYLRTGQIQLLLETIRHFGFWGVLLGIFVQTVVNILPVPGEFITIFLMEIYGVWWGTFYSWIAGIVGAIAALYITRWMARPIVERIASSYIQKVNTWIQDRETFGLLSLRFIPLVPYHLLNYAAGVLRVRLWPFLWTTALGILPFHLAVGGMYAGFRYGTLVWGIIGGLLFILLILFGYFIRAKETKK
ncbi:hypothetical protein DNHGIG_08490 [Collibacillus ludicampi]|uniref:TVP38/TMEM64 family membrane protein n=1 Tax=Collibacillus ludicampi TaxID=2771369 RepID=A0AAV4LC16_9BACL|nr:VTT domain-containing protein [Collibacillus ludicampi]GIM45300.1 hypothetical protein DNHGIG_08490 [Collibacillus ludicampi]